MRILTPNTAAFTPTGITSGLPLVAEWSITEDVSGDFGPLTVNIFTPDDGFYLVAVMVKTNTAGGGGSIVISPSQPGSGAFGGSSVTGNLASAGAGGAQANDSTGMMFAAGGVFSVDREVTLYAAGPSNYSAYVKVYKMAG